MHYPPRPVTLLAPQAAPSPSASPAAPVPRPRRRFPWGRLFLVVALLGLAVVSTIVLSFRMGGGARTVRQVVMQTAGRSWTPELEFGVGRLPALAARTLVRFAPVEPEIRSAVSAFRHADVGIYRPNHSVANSASHPALLAQLRDHMARDGWDPVVTVSEPGQLVAIFVDGRHLSSASLTACVVVMERDSLVVVSGAVDPRPLIDLVNREGPFELPMMFSSR